jgi:tRNA (guanine-N7-)-methyltransferase
MYKMLLKTNGTIHLKTDSALLHAYTKEKIEELGLITHKSTENLYQSDLVDEILSIKTYYEKKYLAHDKNINYLKFSFK